MNMPLYIFHEGGGSENSAPYNAFNMEVLTPPASHAPPMQPPMHPPGYHDAAWARCLMLTFPRGESA